MHCSTFNPDSGAARSEAEVLLAVTTLVTESRIPEKIGSKCKGFKEGPPCFFGSQNNEHICNITENLCFKYESVREEILKLWIQNIPLCIEVILTCGCQEEDFFVGTENVENCILLESWNFTISNRRPSTAPIFQIPQLVNAIKSQLYFSQITAWLTTQKEKCNNTLTQKQLRYRIAFPGETFETTKFMTNAVEHNFPSTDIGCSRVLNISYLSLPRMSSIPSVLCPSCKKLENLLSESRKCLKENAQEESVERNRNVVDDRMHTNCTLKGKHHCEDYEEVDNAEKTENLVKFKRFRQNLKEDQPSTSTLNQVNNSCSAHCTHSVREHITSFSNSSTPEVECLCMDQNDVSSFYHNDLICKDEDKSRILLEAIERVGLMSPERKNERNSEKNNVDAKFKRDSTNDFRGNNRTSNRQNRKCLQNQCFQCLNEKNNFNSFRNEPERIVKLSNGNKQSADLKMSSLECANKEGECDNVTCDMSKSDTCSNKKSSCSIYVKNNHCDSPIPSIKHMKGKDISNTLDRRADKRKIMRKLTFEDMMKDCEGTNGHMPEKKGQIPTAMEQANFRRNLDSAASMVFHSRTGLPLTSSPAPVRKGKTCFDFDSSINSVSSIRSALFSSSFSTDDDSESDGSLVSPCSPETFLTHNVVEREQPKSSVHYQRRGKGHASCLLGSFEESVLNGRLEPVSTVQGFTAELGASGSFVPKHLVVPVTVFFYTLGDNDKVSSPYLCHINLGKKGYCVPKRGTVQVTLFNPLGTVVKMFVIVYDLTDMPPNAQTFIRQRTLYLPNDCKDEDIQWCPKWLKYLIHLRFVSSKSGKIYLHSDVRMIIFHKSDFDTATAHDMDLCYELRSFTLMPTNPRFSPRK